MKSCRKYKFCSGLLIGSVVGAVLGAIFAPEACREWKDNMKTLVASVTDGLNDYHADVEQKISEIENDVKMGN